jgi:hypothetical protein
MEAMRIGWMVSMSSRIIAISNDDWESVSGGFM